jgi:FkbM family methyltransferase
VQPELPLWLTAAGNPETFGLAGTLGMGLLTHLLTQSREELAEKIRLYRNAWRSAGNDGEGHVTLMIHTFVDRDAERALDVVREPFTAYLRSSLNLVRPIASSMGVDLDADDFDDATQRMVLDHAFQRFAESSALFGSAESCLAQVEALKDLGVDEIGCLIDFGCPTDEVLGSFDELRDLLRWSNPRRFPDAAADRSVAAQIRRHGVETLQCTPSMARLLAAEPKGLAALGSLDRLLLGGETVPEDLVADLAEAGCGRILDVYGPTETTVWSTVDDDLSPQRPVTVGRPLANTQTYVVDRHGRLQPPGVPGELWIGGAGVTRGYLGRPSLTAQRFTPDPYGDQPGARVYRTGDRVRLDRVGRLLFLGRLDHQVKVAGHRIELGEVESLLLRLPGVAETVAVVHQEAGGAPSLAAYVVPEPWAREDASADTFPLPDGRRIAHLGAFQTSVAVRELFEEDWYWKFGLELPDEPWVFDVGANIGLFSLQVVDRRPEAHVVAFEPLPPTFEALSRNLRRWVPNGHAVHAGVADRPGEASFTFYPQMSGLSGRYADQEMDRGSARAIIEGGLEERSAAPSVADEELERFLDTEFESETHTCRLTTLSETIDRLGVERIDLLKIDVERAELDVLRGLRDEHWPLVQQVVAEVDTRENLERIVPMLEARGFEVRVENFFEARAADGSEVLVKMLYARRPDLPAMPPPADLASLRRPVTADALRGYLTRHLAPPMVPNHFVLLEEMPRTPNGKIDRRALPSPREAAAHRERHYVAPQLDSERALAEVWQEVLGVERVGLDENFFELGGTSLLLVQLRSRIQQRLGHEVALVDLFRYPTVGSLDEHLRSQPKSEAASGFERVDDRMEKKRQALNRRRRPPKRGR